MDTQKSITQIEAELTEELVALQSIVLEKAADISEDEELSILSFHARIGRWNTTFVDSIRIQFSDPKDFLAKWIAGLLAEIADIENAQKKKYHGKIYRTSVRHRLLRYLKDPIVRNYIFIFLERNFYRNFLARTRAKPDDHLWQVWFGRGDMTWGILLAPAYRNASWTNDVSEIRRCEYGYWTIGHLMQTGLIDPTSNHPVKWSTLDQFLAFYRSVLKRESNSIYEQRFADNYIKYLRDSVDPEAEPFLIPELRYAGHEKKHAYRLDYSVFNSHTMELTGFELSPASTHMAISGIKKEQKTQVAVNRELSDKWEREMTKRNKYFETYSIPIVTFTDSKLKDIDDCFSVVQEKLAARPKKTVSYKDSLNMIDSFDFNAP